MVLPTLSAHRLEADHAETLVLLPRDATAPRSAARRARSKDSIAARHHTTHGLRRLDEVDRLVILDRLRLKMEDDEIRYQDRQARRGVVMEERAQGGHPVLCPRRGGGTVRAYRDPLHR